MMEPNNNVHKSLIDSINFKEKMPEVHSLAELQKVLATKVGAVQPLTFKTERDLAHFFARVNSRTRYSVSYYGKLHGSPFRTPTLEDVRNLDINEIGVHILYTEGDN